LRPVPRVVLQTQPEKRSRRAFLPALTRRRLAIAALVAALLLFLSGLGLVLRPSGTVAAIDTRGQLTVFDGTVQLRHANGAYAPALNGAFVAAGDSVRTAAGGHAALSFFDRSIVVFEPNTELTIVSLNTSDRQNVSVVMRQTDGKTWHVIDHPLPATAKYEVITPTADATVHGTAFQVVVGSQGSDIVTTDGVVTVVGSFQVFDTIAVTTKGGPADATRAINYYIYQRAFERLDFGYASALAVILMIILAGVALLQNKLLRANESDLER